MSASAELAGRMVKTIKLPILYFFLEICKKQFSVIRWRLIFLFSVFILGASPVFGKEELKPASENEKSFLDRLMEVESGGNPYARNLRSSAVGHFQFIRSTFLEVARRYFSDEIAGKSDLEILLLRLDPKFARQAALAYTRENASFLAQHGITTEPGHLRLAFLLGPSGALKVLTANPDTPLSTLLSSRVITANPYMALMTANDIIKRSKLEVTGIHPFSTAGSDKNQIKVLCNLKRPSCRQWLYLAKQRLLLRSKKNARNPN